MLRAIVTQLCEAADIPKILVLRENISVALSEARVTDVSVVCLVPSSRTVELKPVLGPLFDDLMFITEDIHRLDVLFLQLESLHNKYDSILYVSSSMYPTQATNLLDLFQDITENQILASANPAWPDIFCPSVFLIKPNVSTYQTVLQYSQFENSFSTSNIDFICYILDHLDWIHLPYVYNITATQLHERCSYQYLPATQRFFQDVKMVNFENDKPWKVSSHSTNYRYAKQWCDTWMTLFPHLSNIDTTDSLALEKCAFYFNNYIHQKKVDDESAKLEIHEQKSKEPKLQDEAPEHGKFQEAGKPKKISKDDNADKEQIESQNELAQIIPQVSHTVPITAEDLQKSYVPCKESPSPSREDSSKTCTQESIPPHEKHHDIQGSTSKIQEHNPQKYTHTNNTLLDSGIFTDQSTKTDCFQISVQNDSNSDSKSKSFQTPAQNDGETSERPVWNRHQSDISPERIFPNASKEESAEQIEHREVKQEQFFDDPRPYVPPSVAPERVFPDDSAIAENNSADDITDAKQQSTNNDSLRNRVMSFFTNPSTYSVFETVNDYQTWNPKLQDPKDLKTKKGEAQLLIYHDKSLSMQSDSDINKKQNERILHLFTESLANDFQKMDLKNSSENKTTKSLIDGLITPMSSNIVLDPLSSVSVNNSSPPCSLWSPSSPSGQLSKLDEHFDFSLHPWSKDKRYLKYLKQGTKYKSLRNNRKYLKKKNNKKIQGDFNPSKKPLQGILKKSSK